MPDKHPDKAQKKRIEELQEKTLMGKMKSLSYDDLILLLQYDETLRQLLRKLAASTPAEIETDKTAAEQHAGPEIREQKLCNAEPQPQLEPEPEPEPDRRQSAAEQLSEQLQSALLLLDQVVSDDDLASRWLNAGDNTGQSLLRLTATLAQWDTLLDLWDILAKRCKDQQRQASTHEYSILRQGLSLYNLTLRDRQAETVSAHCKAPFDHLHHQRATAQGDTVTAIWLEGIRNAAGSVQKKPLVATA